MYVIFENLKLVFVYITVKCIIIYSQTKYIKYK